MDGSCANCILIFLSFALLLQSSDVPQTLVVSATKVVSATLVDQCSSVIVSTIVVRFSLFCIVYGVCACSYTQSGRQKQWIPCYVIALSRVTSNFYVQGWLLECNGFKCNIPVKECAKQEAYGEERGL